MNAPERTDITTTNDTLADECDRLMGERDAARSSVRDYQLKYADALCTGGQTALDLAASREYALSLEQRLAVLRGRWTVADVARLLFIATWIAAVLALAVVGVIA